MNPDIQELMLKLRAAVELVMDGSTPQQQRMEAYQACETFKENSPHCAPCGLLMSALDNSFIIRHFGLQLLEHCVKYRWNTMSIEEKVFIKENTMKILQTGTLDLLAERAHIKDALSRVVVEMVKREWPQQWPTLMDELSTTCQLGPTQTELVLMVFLRLAEDVLQFQSIPHQRRREIMKGLNDRMAHLFNFYMDTLQNNSAVYKQLSASTDPAQRKQSEFSCKVIIGVLNTLTAFVDWVSMSYITDRNGVLFEMLCAMLSDTNLQLAAAECLLVIVNRRHKLEDRKPMLLLFNQEPMSAILNAAVVASQAYLVEHHYLFLKRLCQVLTAIGSQLCALWGPIDGVGQPPNFDEYLKAILAFTTHPSQTLGSIAHTLWVSFLRHDKISVDLVFQSFIPVLIDSTKNALVKVGFPSQDNSPSCAYARLDFDADEDFYVFLAKYRAEVAETLRQATITNPEITFPFAAKWLETQLKKPIDLGESRSLCNQSSPAFLEWDALTACLESVMSRLHVTDKPKPSVADGIQLLRDVLAFETKDPLILSSTLSTISALFPFITDAPDILPSVLNKIFSAAVFNIEGQTKATRSKAVKNVRRHACSVLVKICKQYPLLLLPAFDHLYTHIQQLSRDPEELSQMEKCTLTEALILISNGFNSFSRQTKFLEEVLVPVRDLWLSTQMKESLWSAQKFMSYVGLDQPPVEPSSEDTCGINRSHILHCINFILAVLKRSVVPEDIEVAKTGGFVTGTTEAGNVVMRNPVTPHLLGEVLDCVLALAKMLNDLWNPECVARRHPAFQKSYDMQDTDKHILLGIQPPCVDNTNATSCKHPLERMQSFIANAHQNCYHVLGNCGLSLGHEFYQTPNLAQSLINSVFTNLDAIPVFRLRPIIRVFLKPYVQACPREYFENAVIPILSFFTTYMLQRLTKEWKMIAERNEKKIEGADADDPESQEVLDEQVVRQTSREYLDFLALLLRERKSSPGPDDNAMEDENAPSNKEETISELGMIVLSVDSIYPSFVMSLFTSMSWTDTKTCCTGSALGWRVVKRLVETQKLPSADVCHLFTAILLGLQSNGQHENALNNLMSLALHFYENLRPTFPDLAVILAQVPGCKEKDIQAFDSRVLTNQVPQKTKNMRDSMKKMLLGIIGQNIGQQFKKEQHFRNLPSMCKIEKPKAPAVFSAALTAGDVGLCTLFSDNNQQAPPHAL